MTNSRYLATNQSSDNEEDHKQLAHVGGGGDVTKADGAHRHYQEIHTLAVRQLQQQRFAPDNTKPAPACDSLRDCF